MLGNHILYFGKFSWSCCSAKLKWFTFLYITLYADVRMHWNLDKMLIWFFCIWLIMRCHIIMYINSNKSQIQPFKASLLSQEESLLISKDSNNYWGVRITLILIINTKHLKKKIWYSYQQKTCNYLAFANCNYVLWVPFEWFLQDQRPTSWSCLQAWLLYIPGSTLVFWSLLDPNPLDHQPLKKTTTKLKQSSSSTREEHMPKSSG